MKIYIIYVYFIKRYDWQINTNKILMCSLVLLLVLSLSFDDIAKQKKLVLNIRNLTCIIIAKTWKIFLLELGLCFSSGINIEKYKTTRVCSARSLIKTR